MQILPIQLGSGSLDRRLKRSLTELHAEQVLAQFEIAGITARADIGMQAITHLSARKEQLAAQEPTAAPHLRYISEVATAAIGRVVLGDE